MRLGEYLIATGIIATLITSLKALGVSLKFFFLSIIWILSQVFLFELYFIVIRRVMKNKMIQDLIHLRY